MRYAYLLWLPVTFLSLSAHAQSPATPGTTQSPRTPSSNFEDETGRRILGNATVVLKALFLTRAWQLDVKSADYAKLTGYGETAYVARVARCVYELGNLGSDGRKLSRAQIYFANLRSDARHVCSSSGNCRIEIPAEGAGSCLYSAATDKWDCRRYVSLSVPDGGKVYERVRAAWQFITDHGCPPAATKPPF